MMSIAEQALRRDLVTWATGQIGVVEAPPRSNRVVYWQMVCPSFQGEPWCGAFTTAGVLAVTGINLSKFFSAFFTPSIVNFAKKVGAWKTSNPLTADWCLMNFAGGNDVDHVGFTVAGRKNIEGNTSPTNAGPQRTGGGVYVRTRSSHLIAGWVDIAKLLQAVGFDLAKWFSGRRTRGRYLTITGGPNKGTVLVLQRYLNSVRRPQRTWPVLLLDGDLGPQTAKSLQHLVGATVDGDIGPETVKDLQLFLKVPVTNEKTVSRMLWRTLQRFLNARIRDGKLAA